MRKFACCLIATFILWPLALTANALAAEPAAAKKSCENLAKLSLAHTKITMAQVVPAGTFIGPGLPFPGAPKPSYKDVPAFCRVTADATPVADSEIKIEVWMPLTGWNGKFRGQGNGGFSGYIDYPALAEAVKQGYASAGTDTGHHTTDATWALGHPEKIIDYGYRGIHEMTEKAKAIEQAFYGAGPKQSYFSSCSNGGREALMEAQRFPADYNGILAGAPANYFTHLLAASLWELRATTLDPASYIPAAKIPALSEAVLAACDAQDGLRDGLINDPRKCHFDPDTMICKDADSNSCLTAPQAAALEKIYAGAKDAAGRPIFPGLSPGGEAGPGGWGIWITGNAPGQSLIAFFGVGFFANFIYDKKDWDYKTFDLDAATRLADEKTAAVLNSTDPNLRPFLRRGGKLIIYHGWSDAAIAPLNTIDYYDQVVAALGARDTQKFVRLYMVPGMQHCGGGPGPDIFGQGGSGSDDPERNITLSLEQWVEKGTAPSKIITAKLADASNLSKGAKMTRPLCPYPEVAKYKGSGDINDAANFVCAAQER
jgi:Tannase and feruloyl esterase